MPISNPSMPPVPDGLHVDDLTLGETGLLITARTTAAHASCRVCERASVRVHSRYGRTFNDLPWQARQPVGPSFDVDRQSSMHGAEVEAAGKKRAAR